MPIQPPLFLRDLDHGGDAGQPQHVATALVDFVKQAKVSLHIAIYDFRLSHALGDQLIQALTDLADGGVEVKIAYDHTKPNTRQPTAFHTLGGDPAPKGTHPFLQGRFGKTRVQVKPVLTIPDALANSQVAEEPIAGSHLMHNKYVIRDAATLDATVWTGSTNFTDDAWTHQENNIIQIGSTELCSYFEQDFQELWATGDVASTGVNDSGDVSVDPSDVTIAFSPGEGASIDAALASLVGSANQRVKVASMVLSSHQILGALNDVLSAGVEVTGIYDATEMQGILKQWKSAGNPAAAAFQEVAKSLVGKRSQRYTPGGKHNFMHNKVLVVDDAVATGSFNLSTNATHNSENNLIIQDAGLAEAYASYIDDIIGAYS